MAEENIKKAQLEETVTLQFGNALDAIPALEKTFDFVFIDGMKRRTVDFLSLVWDKVEPD
jgi:predicted O-methyltransferase YrrM